MERMHFETADLTQTNIGKIAAIFPSCITEAQGKDGGLKKAVNFELLRQMLSDVVLEGDEAYEFTWVGKKAAIVEANKPIRKTLRPCPAESVNWDTTENLYIEGDNLEVLKLLQESYLGKVKMIYIDPPYNTGNDFIYRDDFAQSQEEYSEESGQVDENGNRLFRNTDSNGRFHSDWCSMIYSRLMLARNLLSDDGAIFISIDENEIVNLRKICTEVFGQKQFVGQITLLCNPKGRSQDKYIANCHEYILIFSKRPLPPGSFSVPKSSMEIFTDYPLQDPEGNLYRELELRNTHRDFGKHNRKNLWYPIYVTDDGCISLENTTASEAVYPVWDDGFEGCWTWGKEKAKENIHLLVAKSVSGKTKIYRKSYAYSENNRPVKQVKSIWNDSMYFTEKGQLSLNTLFETKEKLFQSPKSVDMIAQCIAMTQQSDALILDFFSGSAATAHAVFMQNFQDVYDGIWGKRKFIMVQLPEPCKEGSEAYKAGYKNICEIGKERIRRAGEYEYRDVCATGGSSLRWDYERRHSDKTYLCPENVDIGFRVFKLDDSNMTDVYYSAGEYDQTMLDQLESNIKPDRTDLDLLFGCLLEWGLPLSMPYTSEKIEGCTVHTYNDGDLIACFDENIPDTVIKEIAKRQPLRAVFRDSSFADSPAKINVGEIFKMLAPDTRVKVL